MDLKEQEWRVPLPTWTDRNVAHAMTATLPLCDFIDVNKGVYLILKSPPTENDFSLKIMEVAKKHPEWHWGYEPAEPEVGVCCAILLPVESNVDIWDLEKFSLHKELIHVSPRD